MAQFRLEALAPRRYCVGRNADGSKRWAPFTAEDVQAHAGKLNRMLAAGVSIPVCWEHRDDNHPKHKLSRDQWATEQAKGTAGWLEKVELDAATNTLFNVVEIPDPADAKKAETLRFCSPQIEPDVIDGDGHEWGRAFTHLALTPRPIHQHQQPIQRLSAGQPVAVRLDDVVRLSVDPSKGDDMAEAAVETPVAKPASAGGEVTNATLLDFMKDMMTKMMDVISGKNTTEEERQEEDDEDDFEGEVRPVPPTGTGPGPLSMSLEAATERAGKIERVSLGKRIDRLLKSKRITPAIHGEMKKGLDTVKLSFNAKDGNLKANALTIRLEAYEALEKGAAWSERQEDVTKLSQGVRPAKRPPHATTQTDDAPADESAEARKKRMDDWAEMGR